METDIPSAPKRLRVAGTNMSLHLTECVRMFDLPQQFPSKVPSGKILVPKAQDAPTKSTNGVMQQITRNLNAHISSKLQKLKLKSPDGRDLGEFQVQLLPPREDVLKNKSTFLKLPKLPVLKHDRLKEELGMSLFNKVQKLTNGKQSKEMQESNEDSESSSVEVETSETNGRSKSESPKVVIVSKENRDISVAKKTSNAPQKLILVTPGSEGKNFNGNFMKIFNQNSSTANGDSSSNNIRNSGLQLKSILKDEREGCVGSEQEEETHAQLHLDEKTGEYYTILRDSNDQPKRIAISMPNGSNVAKTNNSSDKSELKKLVVLKRKMVQVEKGTSKETLSPKEKSGNSERNSKSKPWNCISVVRNEERRRELIDVETDEDSILVNRSIKKKKVSKDSLSILEKALESVTDVELRAKALEALADCGIGIQRHVPLKPPPYKQSIKDSSAQTNVFGLLDHEQFVLVTEESPNIERINQTKRSNVDSEKTGSDITVKQNLYNSENLSLLSPSNVLCSPFPFDLGYLDNESTTQAPIKDVLFQPKELLEKVYFQMQRDLESAKTYDKHGYLGIHRAVLNGNVKEVKRQIIVQKCTGESIDALTKNGKTSLELAVSQDASPDIIRLLLQAGAIPAHKMSFQNSALLIASRRSSPLLPEIIGKISNSKLLDTIDTSGFASLHYCAQFGYLPGVNSLVLAGANVNLRDGKSGRTALFHAIENNHMEVAQKLLDNGAYSNVPNFAGQTVMSYMEEIKNQNLRTYLSLAQKYRS